jgi:hypothetical protein
MDLLVLQLENKFKSLALESSVLTEAESSNFSGVLLFSIRKCYPDGYPSHLVELENACWYQYGQCLLDNDMKEQYFMGLVFWSSVKKSNAKQLLEKGYKLFKSSNPEIIPESLEIKLDKRHPGWVSLFTSKRFKPAFLKPVEELKRQRLTTEDFRWFSSRLLRSVLSPSEYITISHLLSLRQQTYSSPEGSKASDRKKKGSLSHNKFETFGSNISQNYKWRWNSDKSEQNKGSILNENEVKTCLDLFCRNLTARLEECQGSQSFEELEVGVTIKKLKR